MTGARITLLGSQHEDVTRFMDSHPDGHERAAIGLFRRLHIDVDHLPTSDRYIAVEIIPMPDEWMTESSDIHISFKLEPFREIFRRCKDEGLVMGFIHNHPAGVETFSSTDDKNEVILLNALSNRNGCDVSFIAMLWVGGKWIARVRTPANPTLPVSVKHTLVIGEKLQMFGYSKRTDEQAELHARQAAAFGQPFVDMLQSLRVGVIGTSGTGSPFSTLAARAGVGELVLIDKDGLNESNLNRVRGLIRDDIGIAKPTALKSFIESIGLDVEVGTVVSDVDNDPAAVDALASCDVIVGCTDDFAGRELLNLASYVYAQAYIDIGLGGKIGEDEEGDPILRNHFGRISTILPEHGQCLFCQGVIKDVWIQTQLERRKNPNLTNDQIEERYLEDGATDAPGVGPFTNASADFALATLFDLLKSYRRFPPNVRSDMFNIDFVAMRIYSHATKGDPNCPYCKDHDFLVMSESNRLNRPFLGKRNEYF